MNITEKPYFIVTQYYGNESFEPITGTLQKDIAVSISDYEHWLHIITQLIDGLLLLAWQGNTLQSYRMITLLLFAFQMVYFVLYLLAVEGHVLG